MSIASQLMAYPSWTARRRTVDQPQPVEAPNWPICFPQRRVPEDEELFVVAGAGGYGDEGGNGAGGGGGGSGTLVALPKHLERIIEIIE